MTNPEQISRIDGGLKKQPSIFKSDYRRTYEASPNFLFNIGALGTSASVIIDLELDKPACKKYLPLTNIRITNNSSVAIYFYPNQKSEGFLISAGTIIAFDSQSMGGGLHSFKITNSSGATTISSAEVQAELWKEGVEVNSSFRALHKQIAKLIGYHKSPIR